MPTDIKILGPDDLNVLSNIASDVFDNRIDQQFATEFLDDPRHHLAAAIDDGQVVGFASAVHYVHPDKPPELWINEVGVAPGHQGRGIGRALMRSLFELARTLECKEAWVLAEGSNEGAQRFYTALGGEPSSAVMFSFRLNDRDIENT